MSGNIIASFEKALRFAIWGAVGGAVGSLISEPIHSLAKNYDFTSLSASLLEVGFWFGVIGACIAVGLLMAISQYLKRGFQISQALQGGIWVGLLAGAAGGVIAQYTYHTIGSTDFLRIVCWGIAGSLLGLGLSFRIPNLEQWRGTVGGLTGGLLGGSLFVLVVSISEEAELVGRILGTMAIGLSIGLMLGVIEVIFREAWLEVQYGIKETRTVSLGTEPISIGSDPKACTIYVCSAAPVALRYQIIQGQILCEDILAGTTYSLHSGDQRLLGTVMITVRAASSSLKFPDSSAPTSSQIFAATTQSQQISLQSQQLSLHIKKHVILLANGTEIRSYEIPGLEPQAVDGIVAVVNCNPKNPTVLGLKNCSHQTWTATFANGKQKQIEPGRTIRLMSETRVRFTSTEGEIK